MKSKTSDDLFLRYFGMQPVEILMQVQTGIQTEDGVNPPLSVRGFILDADSDILYIGDSDNPETVTMAVRRENVTLVQLIDEFGQAGDELNRGDFN